MAYSSESDLLKEFTATDLARLTGSQESVGYNSEKIAHARANADTIIDAYMHGRYENLIEGGVDPIINKISVDLTVANLFEYSYSRSMVPQTIITRKNAALRLLKELQTGTACLQTAMPGTNAPPPIISNKTGNTRLFSEEKLEQFLNK